VKVLMIGPFPERPETPIGGVEAVIATLAPALALRPEIEEMHVLSFLPKVTEPRDVRIGDKLRVWYQPGQRRLALPTRSFLDLLAARRLAVRIRPDIVHGQGIGMSGYLATRIGGHSVVTVHGLNTVEARMVAGRSPANRVRAALVEHQARSTMSAARLVIFISAHYDARLGVAPGDDKCIQIPNPVDARFFEARTDQDEHVQEVLFAGQIIPRKNVVGIVSAFALVSQKSPTARLVIAGPSPDAAYLREVQTVIRDHRLADRVVRIGNLDHTELFARLQRCRALVLFSWEENLPRIIAEAMAAGKPVIASNVGGISEMIQDGVDGFLVAPGDGEALSDRLARLLNSPELQERLAVRGREKARALYDPNVVAQRTVEAYETVRALDYAK
jgi:glycosyltransferase involved in cell wall biosynthesis